MVENVHEGSGEMGQWLRAYATLAEEPNVVSSTHVR